MTRKNRQKHRQNDRQFAPLSPGLPDTRRRVASLSGHDDGAQTREQPDAPGQQRSGAPLGRRLARRAHLLGHPVLSGFLP
jgi:hypothetical protein